MSASGGCGQVGRRQQEEVKAEKGPSRAAFCGAPGVSVSGGRPSRAATARGGEG